MYWVSQSWDTAGPSLLASQTYPSKARLNYSYDQAGRLTAITLNPVNSDGSATDEAQSIPLLSGVSYTGLNLLKAWQWGSGVAYSRSHDAHGRLRSYPQGNPVGTGAAAGLLRTLGYDAAGRVRSYTHTDGSGAAQAGFDQSFGYDGLDRLSNNVQASTTYAYTYDLSHNRSSQSIAGIRYNNTIAAASNRQLAENTSTGTTSFTYDASGNLTSDGSNTFAYAARGRLASVTPAGGAGTISYKYNALEQRLLKSGPTALLEGGARYYAYDEQDHLIGEYDAAGNPVYELVFLGDTPVAVITQLRSGSTVQTQLSYVYADHLDTARLIVRAADHAIIWRWDQTEPFGNSLPNDNPSGLGSFTFNHRFPGQFYDKESRLAYNLHRDYRAQSGRYVQSDPIGLAGGINTYAYVNGQPTRYSDPLGLWSTEAHNYFLNEFFPGLDPSMMAALQAGSAYADSWRFQDAASAFMHAMSSDKLSPAESRMRMCQFIKDKRDLYSRFARDPKLQWSAFFEMGMALHAAMDATSPAHRGFQRWRYRNTLDHGPNKPGAPSMEDVDTAVRYRSETLDLMRKAFNGTLDCDCLP